MQTISILGCGWLGLPLGKHLAQAGHKVKGSTTNENKMALLKEADIKPYLIKLNPEVEGDPSDFFDTDLLLINVPPRNQNGAHDFHERQLHSISKLNKAKHVLFISSTAVYPSNNKVMTEGDADMSCVSRGGVSLLKMEKLFTDNTSIETTVIRFGGLYGPERHPGRFLAGKKNLAGGNNPVNMIHLDDCIGVIQSMIKQNLWGEIFNATSPTKENRASFYKQAAKTLGLEAPTFSEAPAPYKIVSSEKLITSTGYQFKH